MKERRKHDNGALAINIGGIRTRVDLTAVRWGLADT